MDEWDGDTLSLTHLSSTLFIIFSLFYRRNLAISSIYDILQRITHRFLLSSYTSVQVYRWQNTYHSLGRIDILLVLPLAFYSFLRLLPLNRHTANNIHQALQSYSTMRNTVPANIVRLYITRNSVLIGHSFLHHGRPVSSHW